MCDTSRIYHYEFHHPQQNLSRNGSLSDSQESVFAAHFIKSYRNQFAQIHSRTDRKETLFIREVPVAGNGIADLMVLNWSADYNSLLDSSINLSSVNPTLRAFEFKLSNWRSGMMQAHRYRYFSHASILVLPKEKLRTVKTKLELFKTINVGLWCFEPTTGIITRLYTPRPKKQLIPKYAERALKLISQSIQS